MTEIILKSRKKIDKRKREVLIRLLESWDIEAELTEERAKKPAKNNGFTLAEGLWEDYNIDAGELRKKAWRSEK